MPLLSNNRRLHSAAERNRDRSSAAPSSRSRQRNEPAELPEYEPPTFPLSAGSKRAISQLSSNTDTRSYEKQLNKSIELLSASVRDLNDKYAERKETLQRLREKRGEDGEKNDRERAEEKAMSMLENTVPHLTDECDRAVRSVIDLKIELEDSRKVLEEMEGQVEAGMTNTAQRRGLRSGDGDDDMPDAEMPGIIGPLQLLHEAKEQTAADYAAKSLYQKYGLNNDYIGFKRLWHDAVERDGKPLPDASRWFSQDGGHDADDDEDLIIAEEHVDIRCPLSMGIMQDPYTSQKCKHTFEKSSIVQFLASSGGEAPCPQTGCGQKITIRDFQPDPVMLRRIKRREAAEQASMDDYDDDVNHQDSDGDVDMNSNQKIKSERGGKGRGRQSVEDDDGEEEEN